MAKRILLVDDEEETRNVFHTALKNAGYDVTIAGGGKEAVSLVSSQEFDLILLDQMMPDMSGNETLKSIKSTPNGEKAHTSMLTNFAHDEMIKEALNAGASDYILKYQVSADDLVKKVKSIVGE